jgi:CheY-like chemotaxis protein
MDGRQAIDLFSRHQTQLSDDENEGEDSPIQMIFMDLQMPVCGGIEATQQIRALEKKYQWRKSFLFVMTGQDSTADRKAAEQAGADEYFVKPVVMKQLDRVVKQYFPAFGGR